MSHLAESGQFYCHS